MECCFLEILDSDKNQLLTGTGFIVEHNRTKFLVSNRHVLSGRNRETTNTWIAGTGIRPAVAITVATQDLAGTLSSSHAVLELIGPELRIAWREHSSLKREVDIAVLPIPEGVDLPARVLNLDRAPMQDLPEHRFSPAVPDRVMVVGYPLGLNGGSAGLGVWVQGTIASEFDLPIDSLPRFLIDSRTRPGMSGSPVYYYPAGQFVEHPESSGLYRLADNKTTQFLGIYSGRVTDDSDLGFVWQKQLIVDVITEGVPGSMFG